MTACVCACVRECCVYVVREVRGERFKITAARRANTATTQTHTPNQATATCVGRPSTTSTCYLPLLSLGVCGLFWLWLSLFLWLWLPDTHFVQCIQRRLQA